MTSLRGSRRGSLGTRMVISRATRQPTTASMLRVNGPPDRRGQEHHEQRLQAKLGGEDGSAVQEPGQQDGEQEHDGGLPDSGAQPVQQQVSDHDSERAAQAHLDDAAQPAGRGKSRGQSATTWPRTTARCGPGRTRRTRRRPTAQTVIWMAGTREFRLRTTPVRTRPRRKRALAESPVAEAMRSSLFAARDLRSQQDTVGSRASPRAFTLTSIMGSIAARRYDCDAQNAMTDPAVVSQ